MKVVTTIITILAIAGQSLSAGLQSHQSGEEEDLLLTRYMERTQAELESQHLNSVSNHINDQINSLFTTIDSQLTEEVDQSLTNITLNDLQSAEESETESMANFG